MVALFLHQHDMPSVLGAEWLADLADLSTIYGFFQRIYIAERRNPSQFAAGLLYGGVGAQFACHGVEGLYGLTHFLGFLAFAFDYLFAEHHALVSLIDGSECLCLLGAVCAHRALNGDVCGTAVFGHMAPAHPNQTVHCLLVLQVFGRSLRAIAFQLFLETLGGVDALCLGFRHFEFEIDEHIQVFIHRLRVDGACLVVFLIDVEELLCAHGFAIDGHERLFLRKGCHSHCSHCYQ